MGRRSTPVGRRLFVRGLSVGAVSAVAARHAGAQAAPAPAWGGAVVRASEGQAIPPSPDGRKVLIKVDSQLTPGVRMSMITEDLPPNSEIKVHYHQREDEIIFIRMGKGIATLGEREVPVGAGDTVYVPQGVWHGLRNDGQEMLGMCAIYAPPGFEQAFKERPLRPNRTEAEREADRKKYGVVFRG